MEPQTGNLGKRSPKRQSILLDYSVSISKYPRIMIPLNSPFLDNKKNQRALIKAFKSVLSSQKYILGEQVRDFEQAFANKFGAISSVGVANGTDAISIALRALDIGPGDEVITVGNTALATIAAIIAIGATPVIVDVDIETGLIDESSVSDAISQKTRAIVLVHLFGNPVDVQSIRRLLPDNVKIIEDCAQAHGAQIHGSYLGTIGDIGCFSFYPTKILGAIGDGGCILSNDNHLLNKIRRIREYGWNENRIALSEVGINSRLDEIQAAILLEKLKSFDVNFSHRSNVASYYRENINSPYFRMLSVNSLGKHAYHLFVGKIHNRDEFLHYMASKRRIEVGVHYRSTILDHHAYLQKVRLPEDGLKNSILLSKNIVSLPMNNYIKNSDLRKICEAINEWAPE